MPLTIFQKKVAMLLAQNRSEDSHLAGAAGLHLLPNSQRYSVDLDYFHDSEERVLKAFTADRHLLEQHQIQCQIEISQVGYIRCVAHENQDSVKIEWARDTSWRFMPVVRNAEVGWVLHPIDLAINKVLALAGRDEVRDYWDVIYVHQNILSLGALIWAACGKDPGFNPASLLNLVRRRGRYRQEDINRLQLVQKVDIQHLKTIWLEAIADAESFINSVPPEHLGCLFYSVTQGKFLSPTPEMLSSSGHDLRPHFGKPGGILPQVKTG